MPDPDKPDREPETYELADDTLEPAPAEKPPSSYDYLSPDADVPAADDRVPSEPAAPPPSAGTGAADPRSAPSKELFDPEAEEPAYIDPSVASQRREEARIRAAQEAALEHAARKKRMMIIGGVAAVVVVVLIVLFAT